MEIIKVNGRNITKQMRVILEVLKEWDTWINHGDLFVECNKRVNGVVNIRSMHVTLRTLIEADLVVFDKYRQQVNNMSLPRYIKVYSIA